MITLTHPFKETININQLLDITIDGYVKWLKNEAEMYVDQMKYEGDQRQSEFNKYKGDGLELLVEYLIKAGWLQPKYGINKDGYKPVDVEDDCGVDGVGISDANLRPLTVQVKYKSNPMEELTANKDHLTNFGFSSIVAYGVDKDDNENMVIITTGKGVNWKTALKMLHNRMRCINREDLQKIIDPYGLGLFKDYIESVKASQTPQQAVPKIELRQHQVKAVKDVMDAIKNGVGKGIVESPTGTGKTLEQAEVIKEFIK